MSLKLREYRDADAPFMQFISSNPQLQSKLFSTPTLFTEREISAWIKRRARHPGGEFLVVVKDNTLIGFIQISNIEPVSQTADIAICIVPQWQGQGFGTEAMELLEKRARQDLGLKRLTLRVLSSNEEAISLYQKSGYKPYGIMMEKAI